MKKILVFVLAFVAVLACGGALHAGVVFQDDFNGENSGVANGATLNYTGFANWKVTGGSVDLIGNGYYDFYPGNGLYVDLDGSTNQAGVLTTKQSFAPGTYTLEFNLAGNAIGGSEDVYVSLGTGTGNWSTSFIALPSNGSFSPPYSFTFTTTASGPLSFYDDSTDNVGAILDNVKLSTTAVPEPSILLLLGPGLVGFGAIRRRLNK